MVASSVIDVILGEAGGQTEAQRYADMVAIASVIQNRANLSGLDPISIISVQSEFNAYGKALPKGVEAHRDLAEAAWNQVQTTGPVHNATYYATSKAKDGLPNSLRAETTTTAHEYFSDPQARSFRTAQGFVAPGNPPMQAFAALPDIGPIPTARPEAARTITPGLGLANLVPQAPAPSYGRIDYAHPERGAWSAGLVPDAITSAQMLAANSPRGLNITSAYRSPNHPVEAGKRSPGQHARGTAFDIDLSGMTAQQRADMVELASMTGATRLGAYSRSPNMMHVDFAPNFAPTHGTVYAMMDRSRRNMNRAPDWFSRGLTQVSVPTPTARPTSVPPVAAPVGPVNRAPLPAIGALPAAPSARQAQEQSMDDFYDALGRTKELDRFGNVYTYDPRSKEYTAVTNRNVTQRAIEDQSMRALAAMPAAPRPAPPVASPVAARAADDIATAAISPFPTLPAIAPALPTFAPRAAQIQPPAQAPAQVPGSFPAAPPAPGRQAAKSALTGAIKGGMMGGIPGMIVGAIAGPALGRMGRNLSNRTNPFAGMFNDYRGLGSRLGGLGNLFGGIGLLSTPNYGATPFGVGSGMSAISGVFGMPAGATAYSRSNPEVSFTSLGNGMVSRSNSKTGVTYSMSAGDYEGPSGGRSSGGKGGKGTGGLY